MASPCEDEIIQCSVCNEDFTVANKSLQCSGMCKRSFHPKCLNINKSDYKTINENRNIK